MSFKVLASKTAAALDKELMSSSGFTLEQLMELAGLSVAQAIYKEYPPLRKNAQDKASGFNKNKVLVISGSGNNGGDGLVASRHLKLFGYEPIVYYPKQNQKLEFFNHLTQQLDNFEIQVITDILSREQLKKLIDDNYIIVDSMFGFSFRPPMREPFGEIVDQIIELKNKDPNNKKIVSVDVPTGWDVDNGPDSNSSQAYLKPDMLVSLTAPKPCSTCGYSDFVHYLGGRFISQQVADKWDIQVPDYPGVDQVVKLS